MKNGGTFRKNLNHTNLNHLNEEEFRFAGKGRTLVSSELAPESVGFVGRIVSVQDVLFPVRQTSQEETVTVTVVHLAC